MGADPDCFAEDGQEELALGAAAAEPFEETIEGTGIERAQDLFLPLCLHHGVRTPAQSFGHALLPAASMKKEIESQPWILLTEVLL